MYFKKILSIFMVVSLMGTALLGTAVYAEDSSEGIEVTKAGGWYESIFAEWTAESDAQYSVYYKLSTDSAFTAVDSELIRVDSDSSTARVDVLGLLGGQDYDLKISDGTYYTTISGIETNSYDRDGYAHWNYTEGVGAYNDDGTPKDGAVIIYVSEDTKNTVTATLGGTTYTGIIDILSYAKKSSYPVIVRVLDKITCPQYSKAQLSTDDEFTMVEDDNNDGTTAFTMTVENNTFKYTQQETQKDGTTGDWFPYNMLSIKSASNITIEGVGEDACFYQWGITLGGCTNAEVRNLTFTNTPEDCIGIELGDSTRSSHVWLHNNVFNIGKNLYDCSKDKDKAEGDGSTDVKNSDNVTFSYNVYNSCHKTSLCGSSTSNTQTNITYHHNYFNKTQSRNPRARNSNIHLYNNYFYGNTSYGAAASYNSHIFSEANYFDGAQDPLYMNAMGEDAYSGTIKSWNDVFSSCTYSEDDDYFYCYTATARDDSTTIANLVEGGEDYSNFDISDATFYYDSTNKKTDADVESAADAKATVLTYSGILTDSASNMAVDLESSSSSGEETTEETTEATDLVNAVYNFSDCETETISENTTLTNGVSVLAESGKTVAIDNSSKTVDGIAYTNRIKLGGTGSFGSYRVLQIPVAGSASIKVVCMSSSSDSSDRNLVVYAGSSEVGSQAAPSSAPEALEYEYSGSADTLSIYSDNNGINIYSIMVFYPVSYSDDLFELTEAYPKANPNYFNITLSNVNTYIHEVLVGETKLTNVYDDGEGSYTFPVFLNSSESKTAAPSVTVKYADSESAEEYNETTVSLNTRTTAA